MKNIAVFMGGLIVVAFLAPRLIGSDVCIPNPITVRTVEGIVLFEVDEMREPLSDVTVEVTPYGYKKNPIAKAITNQDGRFALPQITAGKYYLSVQHAVVIGLQIEMRVKPFKETRRNLELIQVVLRNDPSKYCAGSTVTVAIDR